jgi:hypothetical protein
MNNIKQRKASLDSANKTHTHSPPSEERIEAETLASAGCRQAAHSHCG